MDPFVTTPLDYSTLHLTWVRPVSADCVNLRLVRNAHNLSQFAGQPPGATTDALAGADGTILFTDLVSRLPNYTDTGLGSGFFYYTMWGWSNSEQAWIRCSDVIGLVPINWGYSFRLYGLLPAAYRDRDNVLVDPYNPWDSVNTGTNPLPPLQRYLGLIGFQFDFIRTELESLMSVNDPENCSGALLPIMAQQFALPHEPEIGMQQERQLIQNAVHLYKLKGSPQGITEFCSIMTGYPATVLVHHGYNLMLCTDDSIGVDDSGTWQSWPPVGTNWPTLANSNQGLTISYNPDLVGGPDAIPGMTDPVGEIYGANFPFLEPPYNDSGIEVQATGPNILSAENSSFEGGTTGTWTAGANTAAPTNNASLGSVGSHSLTFRCTRQNSNSSVVLAAQAVSASTLYLFTADFQSLGTLRQVYLQIQWFTSGGTAIGAVVAGPQETEIAGNWVTVEVSATSPSNAASVTITAFAVNAANNETHAIDNVLAGIGQQDLVITTGPIPVTDFMSSNYGAGNITFRIQVWSSVARQVYLSLWGDLGEGPGSTASTPVQIVAPVSFTETAGHWVEMTITGTINPYPATPVRGQFGQPVPTGPASYYWVYPRIRIAGAREPHYLTLMGVWPCKPAQIGVDTPVYDYPRDIKVSMEPQAANLLSNTLTTFTMVNPNAPPPTLGIGFDGLCAAADPIAKGAATCNMSIVYASAEDAPGTIAVNGNAALRIDASASNATVWFGTITTWSPPPGSPYGWFVPEGSDPNAEWFTGAVPGTSEVRPWYDPDMNQENSWFTVPEPASVPPYGNYFGIGAAMVNGLWFALPPQPPQNCNINMFQVQSGQPFNFSIYAKYLSVIDPSIATMSLGFRWYYPDNTWTEVVTSVPLTTDYNRYCIAPSGLPADAYMAQPPPEPVTGVLPIGVFPFVRFPRVQQASFLLNSAMLSPSTTETPYMDGTTIDSQTGDYVQATNGASYFYQRRAPRIARLNMELYRWLPLNSTYTIVYTSGAVMPPLDPTLWP